MSDYKVICHYCFGRGSMVEEGYAECPYCDGTGWVDDVQNDENDLEDEEES